MMKVTTADVIVVGAGMVGLSCAAALAQAGFSVIVLESSTQIPHLPAKTDPFDLKVVALTRGSEYFLQHIHAWDLIQSARSCAYEHMLVWDSELDGRIQFSAVDLMEKNLGHIVEQQVVLGALWEVLQKSEVKVYWGANVKALHHEEKVEIILQEGSTLTAQLIIGADGANSLLRKNCGIESTLNDYQQTALVATVRGDKSHHFTAYQRFAQSGPLALLPLAEVHHATLIWSASHDLITSLKEKDPEEFNEILTRESQGVMGKLRLVSDRFTFPLTSHHAKQYAKNRCVLVGDAAHTLHPLAGQGVNLGFLDVAALVELLRKAKKTNRNMAASNLLQRYERQRRMHNQVMIWAMSLFKQGFGSQSTLIQRARNVGLQWVDKNKFCKQLFARVALGTIGPIPALAKKGLSNAEKNPLI